MQIETLKLYPKDGADFIKWGAMGFVGLGLYNVATKVLHRNLNPCADLIDTTEAMNTDPIIRDAFVNLQEYRELNPYLFKAAVQYIDRLLFLESVLLAGNPPGRQDKYLASTCLRMGINKLARFKFEIKNELGVMHMTAANIYIQQIYTQVQKHILNVFHLCSKFNPKVLVAKAKAEIKEVMEGRAKISKTSKFDKYKRRRKNSGDTKDHA